MAIPEFTLCLCGKLLCSFALVFCSNTLATFWKHCMFSLEWMPLCISCCINVGVRGVHRHPKMIDRQWLCGCGTWNLTLKSLVSGPTLFHTFTGRVLISFHMLSSTSTFLHHLTRRATKQTTVVLSGLCSWSRQRCPRLSLCSFRFFFFSHIILILSQTQNMKKTTCSRLHKLAWHCSTPLSKTQYIYLCGLEHCW